ncbi:tRNA (adenosine(37)-N6)-dimethylallyltransferase MiaA [bacterium]|nr:tRNA (adenosine(37)-N6)-dimethylallyltransferase MiaA [bacterium]
MKKNPKVLVIVGPTASGKTSLSVELAKEFGGEVVSADSRQVYKRLDLGSGKVTTEEMGGVPHHLLDVAEPSEVYTASDFKRDGQKAIKEIAERSKLPIIAGGTFFYVDVLLGRLSTPEVAPNGKLRKELESKSIEELIAQLYELDPVRLESIDRKNPRRLVRAIEVATTLGRVPETKVSEPYDTYTIGIDIDQRALQRNIHLRLLERLDAGMVSEVERLLTPHEIAHERLEDLGLEYRYISRYLRHELTYEEMISELETKIRQFAKRQMTWLKRDQSIHWYKKEEINDIKSAVQNWLEN